MSREAWAKCPSRWARVRNATSDQTEPENNDDVSYLVVADQAMSHPDGGPLPGLSHLKWSKHKGGATAAIMLLFALATMSNLAQKSHGLRTDNRVVVTYDDLARMTELSRALIAKGLKLLQELGAITVARIGNGCVYELVGIEAPKNWCALPQGYLLANSDHLSRLKGIHEHLKRPTSLHAMKLYMLLLAFRDNHSNVARMSYGLIGEYTGMRTAEISVAVQILIGAQLCRLASDHEVPLRKGQRRHNRYLLTGLATS